jgi:transposase
VAYQFQLQTHKDLTLQLVWQEGRESNPDGYGYSRFCDLYRQWLKRLDLVLRQEHRAGEKMFVDYAGATIPVHDPQNGEAHPAAVFVAVLGASNYSFAEATCGQDLRNWIGSHQRAFEFFGGVPQVVIPDNLKSAVTHPSYYEPELNPTYRDLGEHYGVAIIPARPYRARDKAKAEVGVQVVQRWIVAALRKRKFFSLDEVNQAIAELLVRLNQRPFRKREGNRATLFGQLDQPALKRLPATRYQFGEWKTARVNLDYHVEVERHYYSVPYALVHQKVDVHLTTETLEVLHRGVRVASHVRSYEPGKATSLTEHMPKSHQKYVGRTPTRLIEDAQQIGPSTGQLVEAILAAKRHPEMGYRSCLGILRLAKTYPAERMEAAARRALRARAYNFQSMDSILKNQLDTGYRCLAMCPQGPPWTMTTFAAPITSIPRRRPIPGSAITERRTNAEPTNHREVVRHAHARYGRCLYPTTRGSTDQPTQLRGAICAAGGPAVELAGEPGAGEAAPRCPSTRSSLHRRH